MPCNRLTGPATIDLGSGVTDKTFLFCHGGFFKGQFDLASAVRPNPKRC